MSVDVLLGLQWGDEGKGKIVDVLAPEYNIIARYQGGPNAGHTLVVNGEKHVLHTIPSGIFRKELLNVIGNGAIIDPIIFKKEVDALVEKGVDVKSSLVISRRTHLILPTHVELDKASENAKGDRKIGSTKKGIGPTYKDKTGREGLRVGDIFTSNFREKYERIVSSHKKTLDQMGHEYDISNAESDWFGAIEVIRRMTVVDSENFINDEINRNKKVLAEGAQGTLLDVEFGSYPYVTSSNTTSAGACSGLGVSPKKIDKVIGIFKAYCTRVGSGPFPTELNCHSGERMRSVGKEFGATTGRPRRCGWIDLPALKYAIMINGVTELAMMKADVLSGFDEIKVCSKYEQEGKVLDSVPFDLSHEGLKPIYTYIKCWNEDLKGVTKKEQFPQELNTYIAFLESELGVPISIVSVGPDRDQTIRMN